MLGRRAAASTRKALVVALGDLQQVGVRTLVSLEYRRRVDLVGALGLVGLSKRQEHVEEKLCGVEVGGFEVERKPVKVRGSSLFAVPLAPGPSR